MSTITICEQQKTETGFRAIVSFAGAIEYEVAVSNPFTPKEEARLEWYFEQWLVFPNLDTTTAEAAQASVRAYGESLFEQVFKRDAEVYSEYRQMRDEISLVEIVGDSPEFQALHWEALWDPQQPRPIAVDRVMVRRQVRATPGRAEVKPAALIHLLVVTARPGEENDVNHRTISRPLLELIQQSKLRVQVELLRPATFEALTQHLDEKGDGFYHIVHLDMHGAVLSYKEVEEIRKREQESTLINRLTFKHFGRELLPFEGAKALLSFESGIPGLSDWREASELAELLTGKNVPVCILNACQSAKQVQGDERETSLAATLMAAGMQTVLAMGYSVTVSAAAILMQTLYQQLFAQKSLDEAIRLGRKALCDRKERRAHFNQTIRLEDWLLPVVYRREAVQFSLNPLSPQEEEEYWQQQATVYRFESPTYGFVGRDLEILKIERSLLRHNILLVQGMGGTGKTTLLNYLRQWWQTTQFVREVFYFGYDQRAYTLEQIVFAIGQRVYDRYEAAQFQAMPLDAQVPKLVFTLNSEPYGIMLDNLESVTGQARAIQNTLNPQEQAKLRDFLRLLVGGKTRVVLGSRGREAWLENLLHGAVYELHGLDQESRTALAEQILQRQVQNPRRIEQIKQSPEFPRLMKLLAGYPLAMEVVLGNLRRQSAAEILAGLDAADVKLDSGSADKTASILKCVEYSHSNLSPEAQKLLLCLAPFSGFLVRSVLPHYAEQLQQLPPFQDYAFDQLDQAIQEAVDWGLLSPIDANFPHLLTIQPVFPYFLKTRLNQLNEATHEALFQGFKNHYRGLAGTYRQLMDSRQPQERQTGIAFCQWEYENLYNALQLCLEQQESFTTIFACLQNFLALQSDLKSELQLAESVNQAVEQYPAEFLTRPENNEYKIALDLLAYCYLMTKQYPAAQKTYQQTLELLVQINDRYNQARTYHQLGSVAQELRQYEEAGRNYQQALQICIEFNDRYNQASTYHELGRVAQELRQYEEAGRNYQQALQICIEFNDRYNQASTYHNLGMVAQELRQYEEAGRNYQQALQIWIEFNDRYNQARTYHQLGRVAQELRQYEEAGRNYQQALQIFIEFNDRDSQASTFVQLGLLAEAEGNIEEARSYLQQALEIFVEFGDEYLAAIVQENLDRLSS